jgi:hypothetical protein
MKKRSFKRKFQQISFIVLSVVCICLLIYFISSLFAPVQKLLRAGDTTLIVPIVQTYSIDDFEKALASKNIVFETISMASGSSDFVAKLKDGPRVYFSQEKDVDFQVNTLQLIIQRLTIDRRAVISVDLRYDKPIVKW